MSCFGLCRDVIRQWFRRLNPDPGTRPDPVQEEIVRKLLVQLLKPIDEAYGVEPATTEEIKQQLDKYIVRKVDERIAQLTEFCRLAEEIKAKSLEVTPESSGSQSDRKISDDECVANFSGTDMDEIPLDDVSFDMADSTTEITDAKKKKKSIVKKIFKLRPKRRDDGSSESVGKKPSVLRKIFKRLPIV